MKNFVMVALVIFVGLNILFACGGMSPAPAPADVNSVVPDLPSTGGDATATTGTDITNSTADIVSTTVDNQGNALEDAINSVDLDNLSSDLPQDGQNSNNSDADFVATVL